MPRVRQGQQPIPGVGQPEIEKIFRSRAVVTIGYPADMCRPRQENNEWSVWREAPAKIVTYIHTKVTSDGLLAPRIQFRWHTWQMADTVSQPGAFPVDINVCSGLH
jgi:hypothetical protein